MSILLIGGVFDDNVGRNSSYITKLGNLIGAEIINGGNFNSLKQLADVSSNYSCILWFCDIDNSREKLLPNLISNNPHTLIIRSKYNNGTYSDSQLLEMLRNQEVEYLVEFTRVNGIIQSRVLGIGGGIEECHSNIDELANHLTRKILLHTLRCRPLASFTIQISGSGSFGYNRKHHIHEGVDLHCNDLDNVYAIEQGEVVNVLPFTGSWAGSDWWNETACIMVQGGNGVLNYGEVISIVKKGDVVTRGQLIGRVVRVLKNDKGTPTSMLHLERYINGTTTPIKEWKLGTSQPENLLNPTNYLRSIK